MLGDTQLRRVPIALTAGWGGLDTMAIGRLAGRYGSVGAPASAGALLLGASATGRLAGSDGDTDQARFMRQPMADAPAIVRLVPPGIGRALGRFRGLGAGSRLSSGDAGSPPWSPASGEHAAMVAQPKAATCRRIVGPGLPMWLWRLAMKPPRSRACCPARLARSADIRKAWATFLALAWLDHHASEFSGEWTMAVNKARPTAGRRERTTGPRRVVVERLLLVGG